MKKIKQPVSRIKEPKVGLLKTTEMGSKKSNWSGFFKTNVFKKIGILFLVLGVLGLLPYIYSLSMLAVVKEIQISFWAIFNSYSIYEKLVVVVPLMLNIALYGWQIVVSANLIKTNKYSKQILYYIYGVVGIDVISFLLFLPLKQVLYIEIIMAAITWWILIKQDNVLSRFVKGKK